MNINEIQREKDLRKISFADLFYEIFDEQDGYELAWSVIDKLSPEFREQQKVRLDAAYEDGKRRAGESVKSLQRSLGSGMDALTQILLAKAEGRDILKENVEAALEDGLGPSSPSLRISLSDNKVLDALSILPHMTSDQDLIVFFGNNFHATLQNIDAYTGLLYAREFFEYDGEDLRRLVFGRNREDNNKESGDQ